MRPSSLHGRKTFKSEFAEMPRLLNENFRTPARGRMTHDIGKQETRPGSGAPKRTSFETEYSFPEPPQEGTVSLRKTKSFTGFGFKRSSPTQDRAQGFSLPSSALDLPQKKNRRVLSACSNSTEIQRGLTLLGWTTPLTSISASLAGSPHWSAEPQSRDAPRAVCPTLLQQLRPPGGADLVRTQPCPLPCSPAGSSASG